MDKHKERTVEFTVDDLKTLLCSIDELEHSDCYKWIEGCISRLEEQPEVETFWIVSATWARPGVGDEETEYIKSYFSGNGLQLSSDWRSASRYKTKERAEAHMFMYYLKSNHQQIKDHGIVFDVELRRIET